MRRVYHFSAGPAVLPDEVLHRAQTELVQFPGLGYSIMEAGHRGSVYETVHNDVIDRLRRLLDLADDQHVLLLAGGATLQFAMVPLNLHAGRDCCYAITGSWGDKAYADAARVGAARVAYNGKPGGYTTIPAVADLDLSRGAAYLHITSNETIEGVQWQQLPRVDCPLVADMSSDILGRCRDMRRVDLFYAGAQKNLGPAGVTVVGIRGALLERAGSDLPAYLSYATHRAANSLYNTPPVWNIYVVGLVLEWIEHQGGVDAIGVRNARKAQAVYDAIDDSDGFYRNPVDPGARSKMNVVFRLPSPEREHAFLAGAAERGLVGLQGHRSVGGIRASLYNAMPEEGVAALVEYMRRFARTA